MTGQSGRSSIRVAATRTLQRLATATPAIRSASRKLLDFKRSRAYRAACRTTDVDPQTVIFECYAGRAYACSPRALYQAMLADPRFAGFEFVWVFRREDVAALEAVRSGKGPADRSGAASLAARFGREAIGELEGARIVEFGSREYQRAYARAGTWVTNYILPSHLKARDGQRYLQTWHGTPLKRLGCDITADKQSAMFSVAEIHARYRAEGARLTWLVSPSPFATEKLSDAFDLAPERRPSTVIESGYPRNDVLARPAQVKHAEEIRKRLGVPDGRRVVLYAPTFRDDSHVAGVGYKLPDSIDFRLLRERLGDDRYVVLFRPHYLIAREFDFEQHAGFVIDGSGVSDVNDLYRVSDLLVTDYSSVFFDYSLLQRPIIFYMPDLERYRTELRGFYLDLDELPGPIVHTTDRLGEEVRDALESVSPERADELRLFRDRFAPLDDGSAARRVLEHVFPGR